MIVPSASDRKKIVFILEHISEREAFLAELFETLKVFLRRGNPSQWNECLDVWFATAEINAIPKMKETIWRSAAKIPRARNAEKSQVR